MSDTLRAQYVIGKQIYNCLLSLILKKKTSIWEIDTNFSFSKNYWPSLAKSHRRRKLSQTAMPALFD